MDVREALDRIPEIREHLARSEVFRGYGSLTVGSVGVLGVYFAPCGLACLLGGRGAHAYSRWQMGIGFGGGLILGAVVLFWTLERNAGREA